VIAAVIVVLVLLSSGTTVAFAGWTPVPALVSTGALAQARNVCGDVPSADVLASEARGPFVAIVFDRAGAPWQCITRGSDVLLKQTTQYPARLYSIMPADKISTPSIVRQVYGSAKHKLATLNAAEARLIHTPGLRSKHLARFIHEMSRLDSEIAIVDTGPESLTGVTGRAGPGVKSVRFVLADRQTVRATVQDGWYEAWWPGSAKPNSATPTRVRITSTAGPRSSKFAYGPILAFTGTKRCVNGTYCSVFATAALKQQIALALKAHFAFFQNTQPAPVSQEPRVLRGPAGSIRSQMGASLGLDNAQARLVKLPDGSELWIVPGTEGLCVTLVQGHGAGGGCTDLAGVLDWGEAGVSYSGRINGHGTYTLNGLLPNGNKTVSVHMATGDTVIVPVHDNIVYKTFPTAVRWFRFRNAHGTEKNHPA